MCVTFSVVNDLLKMTIAPKLIPLGQFYLSQECSLPVDPLQNSRNNFGGQGHLSR